MSISVRRLIRGFSPLLLADPEILLKLLGPQLRVQEPNVEWFVHIVDLSLSQPFEPLLESFAGHMASILQALSLLL